MDQAAIDFTHLDKYTSGDTNLQREVLRMFVQQSDLYLRALKDSDEHEGWFAAAHSLKGSSRGVGAWKVARLSEKAEELTADSSMEDHMSVFSEIETAIDEVVGCVDTHLWE
jgi:HPt (histidine-containing phosphotransfer) domain-containing protein